MSTAQSTTVRLPESRRGRRSEIQRHEENIQYDAFIRHLLEIRSHSNSPSARMAGAIRPKTRA